jgi:hypothetical protein
MYRLMFRSEPVCTMGSSPNSIAPTARKRPNILDFERRVGSPRNLTNPHSGTSSGPFNGLLTVVVGTENITPKSAQIQQMESYQHVPPRPLVIVPPPPLSLPFGTAVTPPLLQPFLILLPLRSCSHA